MAVTARQRDSLSSQQAAWRPAERHVMPSRPAVTVHTGWQRSTTHTDVDARVALPPAGQLSRACTRTSLRLGCDGLHHGHHRCPATAHSSTVTNCLGQLWLGGGCAETHLRGRRVGPAGRSAMRTAAAAATVLPWTARCHSISAFSLCGCAMVSVPTCATVVAAARPKPRPVPCQNPRDAQLAAGATERSRGATPGADRLSRGRSQWRRSFSGRANSPGAIGTIRS